MLARFGSGDQFVDRLWPRSLITRRSPGTRTRWVAGLSFRRGNRGAAFGSCAPARAPSAAPWWPNWPPPVCANEAAVPRAAVSAMLQIVRCRNRRLCRRLSPFSVTKIPNCARRRSWLWEWGDESAARKVAHLLCTEPDPQEGVRMACIGLRSKPSAAGSPRRPCCRPAPPTRRRQCAVKRLQLEELGAGDAADLTDGQSAKASAAHLARLGRALDTISDDQQQSDLVAGTGTGGGRVPPSRPVIRERGFAVLEEAAQLLPVPIDASAGVLRRGKHVTIITDPGRGEDRPDHDSRDELRPAGHRQVASRRCRRRTGDGRRRLGPPGVSGRARARGTLAEYFLCGRLPPLETAPVWALIKLEAQGPLE